MSHLTTPPPPNEVTNFPVDHDWLARGAREEVIEPDLRIVDAHHHLLDRAEGRYLVPDLLADATDGHNVIATVHVEGGNFFFRPYGPAFMRAAGETEVVVSMTASRAGGEPALCAGIVSYADFFEGAAIADLLDTHIELGKGRFVGIRQLSVWDEDESVRMHQLFPRRALSPGMTADPRFREGFAQMGPRNLVFDATVFHPQIPEIRDLARAFPDTRIVLDHLGCVVRVGPYKGRQDEVFAAWTRDLRAIAELDNVYVKIGGLGMRLFGFGFRDRPKPPGSEELARLWKPFVETAIEAFGPQRAMFESNFPVDKGYFSYRTCWNAFKRLTASASPTEKSALYADTAIACYRLKF